MAVDMMENNDIAWITYMYENTTASAYESPPTTNATLPLNLQSLSTMVLDSHRPMMNRALQYKAHDVSCEHEVMRHNIILTPRIQSNSSTPI